MSQYEQLLAAQIRARGLAEPERQYRFAVELGRDYRLDFAWPDRRLAVEVDGGRFAGRGGRGPLVGRTAVPIAQHQTDADFRKRNLLQLLGWTVLAYPPELVKSMEAIKELELALDRDVPPLPPKAPVWDARLRRHAEATLELDRRDRQRQALKAGARQRKRELRAQLLQEQADRRLRHLTEQRQAVGTFRTSTAPASRTTPAKAPRPGASDAPPDE